MGWSGLRSVDQSGQVENRVFSLQKATQLLATATPLLKFFPTQVKKLHHHLDPRELLGPFQQQLLARSLLGPKWPSSVSGFE